MEAIIVVIVLILLAVISGVSIDVISVCLLGLIGLGFGLLSLYFVFCAVRILRGEKKAARLAETRKSERWGYPTAYYEVEGNIYANAFPCELILKKKLYQKGRECTVYVCKHREKAPLVYDPNAVLSTFAGLFLSLCSAVVIVSETWVFLRDIHR